MQLLVTTNDSRMRLFRLEDFSPLQKFKGATNSQMQIRAAFSQDGECIVSGSENGSVYVWGTHSQYVPGSVAKLTHKRDRNDSYEHFGATDGTPPIVTSASFAPAATFVTARTHLLGQGDPEGYCRRIIVATDYAGVVRVYEASG